MKKDAKHIISSVLKGSIAHELEIEPGDELLAINGEPIEDIFDYQYHSQSEELTLLIKKPDGEEWELEIEKDAEEDLGIIFESGLMDEYRHCHNKCIFCFIDQNPPGMRDTIYFKDDDSRLSFLQGNYITLTNMSDYDIQRIIKYHLSPINISFHTMNPELRCRMLNNRFAGDALKKVKPLYEAGITMNGQIVLCKGWNDGAELEYSISELLKMAPVLQSVSVVPVGLTKYREGLEPLETFDKESSKEVLDIIHKYQKKAFEEHGIHFIHASDEWYIVAGEELPEEERYDGYLQLDNGVGQTRLMMDEFHKALQRFSQNPSLRDLPKRHISTICGRLIYPIMKELIAELEAAFPWLKVSLYPIRNDFFGEKITVTGLITGGDIIKQLTGEELGERLFLPETVLRSGDDIFLDDLRVPDVQASLQVPIGIVKSSGYDLVTTYLGLGE